MLVVIERGAVRDAAAAVRLRDAAAEWLLGRGIEQWRVGESSEARVGARAAAGELFVVRDGELLIAAVVVTFADTPIWAGDDGDAGYIHTLVIDRRHAGTGLGLEVLRHAERHIASQGRTRSRLDCVSTNAPLRHYYRRAGYHEVGNRSFGPASPWSPVTLFEKHLP